ncbi:hypothetical protein PIECOFPK_01053 [Mycovorax composti]|jgi:hypothetical protein|uniref:Uncharacterized protein n=2 Tax=Chitinophagaceae TaxID=563835 RepID=A0ABZ2EJ42_9BACT
MRFILSILTIIYLSLSVAAQSSPTDSVRINDLFFTYVSKNLTLNKSQASSLKPHVNKYLQERRNVIKAHKDPLERERKIADLKIKYRKQFTPIIGVEKANAFFAQEQNFRRQVREELRKRKNKSLNIN